MKKLIPAVLLLTAVGAANAQLSIYGLIDLSYGQNIFDDINGTKANFHSGGDDFSTQGNSTTRVGLKGSAEVGAGVKANFQLETAGITSDGRGRQRRPALLQSPDVGRPVECLRRGSPRPPGLGGLADDEPVRLQRRVQLGVGARPTPWSLRTCPRQSRSLQYISPDFSGFKAQVGFTPEGDPGTKANYSLSLNYNAGPFAIGATTESKRFEITRNFNAVAGQLRLRRGQGHGQLRRRRQGDRLQLRWLIQHWVWQGLWCRCGGADRRLQRRLPLRRQQRRQHQDERTRTVHQPRDLQEHLRLPRLRSRDRFPGRRSIPAKASPSIARVPRAFALGIIYTF